MDDESDDSTEPPAGAGAPAESDDPETPTARASDAFDPAAAFSLLGDETRLRILRELWEAQRDDPDGAVPFERLRERAGVDDSGRFNYHLGKLADRFVERTDGGYRLRFAGGRVVGALLEGTYAPGDDLDVPAGGACSECGEDLRLRYADERVRIDCPACGHVGSDFGCPPGVLAGREAAALPLVVDTHLRTILARARRGICPTCSGPTAVHVGPTEGVRAAWEEGDPDAPDGPPVSLVCERCGELIGTSLPSLLVDRPAVHAFLSDRGVDPEADPLWVLLAALDRESRVVSEEPYRAAATFHVDDEALTVTVDAEGAVREVVES